MTRDSRLKPLVETQSGSIGEADESGGTEGNRPNSRPTFGAPVMTLPNIDELIEKLLSSAKAFRENWIYTQDGDPVLLAVQAEELEQASSALSTLQERRDTLFDAIQHGDQDHKDWLREAIAAHFAGEPVPVPRGSGNKEAMISTLQEQKRKLEEALTPSGDTKAAYIGEVKDSHVEVDEDGEERTVWRPVSWTATKEIMAMIRARALLSGGGE